MTSSTTALTPAQARVLTAAANAPRISSRDHHAATVNALVNRGLLRMVDRFPSGSAIYTITDAGRAAL